jgi:hypothetical protein
MHHLLSAMAFKLNKRSKFYIGLFILALAILLLAIILYLGPNNKLDKTKIEIIFDRPRGPGFDDIKEGDRLILDFESTEPVNVIVIRAEDSGEYFVLENTDVEHYFIAKESNGGSFKYTFIKDGEWTVYFENPSPPPNTAPIVSYWGELEQQDQDLTNHYLNITFTFILMILGLVLLYSSRSKQQKPKKANKKKKSNTPKNTKKK